MTHSYVRVALDGLGKRIDNVILSILGEDVYRQVTVTGDPTDTEGLGAVLDEAPTADAYGPVTRNLDIPNFDSDRVLLADTLTSITTEDVYVKAFVFFNVSETPQEITVTNDAEDTYVFSYPIPPRAPFCLPMFGIKMTGVKVMCGENFSVAVHLVGSKNA